MNREQFRASRARAKADTRTEEQLEADLERQMAEPAETTLERSRALLKRAAGHNSLLAQMATEYALARIWHIENGKPLPRFSNGNYPAAWADDPFKREMKLINAGLDQLRKAWKAR